MGISFTGVLTTDVYKDGTNLMEKKAFLNDLWSNGLKISPALKGTTLNDKIANIITYFDTIEKDEKVGISIDGYEKLLIELDETLPSLNSQVKAEFELQDENVLKSDLLLN